jgi:myo-inositol-1(or 4)-monophosphatase
MSSRLIQTPSALVNVMGKAAIRAAQGLVRDFGEVGHLQVSVKGPRDFVSIADKKSEKVIHGELAKARPTYGFILEEGGAIPGKEDMTWVVDPLDGTNNFLHGAPHFSISIGLLKAGEPIAGLIFDPIKNDLFWAEKDLGAHLNNRRIRVSRRKNLEELLVGASHFDFKSTEGTPLSNATSVRVFGSAALDLAYVAAGRFDAFIGKNLKPWDLVAGMAIVREAGGTVGDWVRGQNPLETGQIFATNGQLGSKLQTFLT